jgi:serine/threonine protein phosphatase PrpC
MLIARPWPAVSRCTTGGTFNADGYLQRDNKKGRGLGMTRSLGDNNFPGLSHEPEITTLDYSNFKKPPVGILMMTDGICSPTKFTDSDITAMINLWVVLHETEGFKELNLAQFITYCARYKREGDDNMSVMSCFDFPINDSGLAARRKENQILLMDDGHGGDEVCTILQQTVIKWGTSLTNLHERMQQDLRTMFKTR